MTAQHPATVARLASLEGARAGVSCRYAYDNGKQKFVFKFFRGSIYLGCVSDPARVLPRMAKYLEVK